VLSRFSNPWIKDTNQRVAADGLSKIPAMVTPTLQECYRRGTPPAASLVLPALFYLFLQRWARGELPYDYQDGVLQPDVIQQWFARTDPLAAYMSQSSLFGELAASDDFHARLTTTVVGLETWLVQPEQPLAVV